MSEPKSRLVSVLSDDTFSTAYSDSLSLPENEYTNSWLHYLQMLNGVCAAGARVATSLHGLSSKLGNDLYNKDTPSIKEWETITHALLEATLSVHAQTLPALKMFNATSQDHHAEQSYQQKVIENILSVINLQYRFCITSCEQLTIIADSRNSKHMGDMHDGDKSNIFTRLHNLSISSSSHSDNMSLQNSIPCLYSSKNDSLQSSQNSSKMNLERTIGDSRDNSLSFYPQNHCIDNYPRDINSSSGKDQFQLDQRNTSFSTLPQNSSLYSDTRFSQQSLSGRTIYFPSSTFNSESSQSPTNTFLDVIRNSRYPDSMRCNSQSKFVPKSLASKNLHINFQTPTTSGLNRQIQSAQLRRWSEAAAHAANERHDDSSNVRRWSVPWDGGQPPTSNNTNYWNDSKYNLREKGWVDEQDSLDTAIFLLSYRTQKDSSDKLPTMNEQFPKRHCTTEGTGRSYSIWSGSGTLPFFQLSESPEQ